MAQQLTQDEVLRHLSDVDYPAGKDDLLAATQQKGATAEVLRAIPAIPPVDYRNEGEVGSSLRVDDGPGPVRGQAAEQARYDSKPGIAQPSRDPHQDRVAGKARTGVSCTRLGSLFISRCRDARVSSASRPARLAMSCRCGAELASSSSATTRYTLASFPDRSSTRRDVPPRGCCVDASSVPGRCGGTRWLALSPGRAHDRGPVATRVALARVGR
ncbi:DUF2795 domain-containing protein [Modestobacter sp. VKM Ac-2984]|uniref:DUF2795 domain-containing protein n=1 Tax=Modestobacter sp. VKM Ac-2984 TaxID=3004138 RepID=UPI0022AA2077|nr:DUF2795 domain-containing protein [Modestobacter sp. VKM Ac-2984]MCZ2817996.1 DUF2795 domain-containing protein [Modestobacter sp. VKM Ac-2984]